MSTTDTIDITNAATRAATQLTRRAVWTATAAATRPQPAIHVTSHRVADGGGAEVRIGDDPHPRIHVEYTGGWTVYVEGRPEADALTAREAEKALMSGLEYCLAHEAR